MKTVLKEDALGRVELLEDGGELRIRRVACGGRVPGSRLLARTLLRRERAALLALDGLEGVPAVEQDLRWSQVPSQDGRAPRAGDVLVRSFQRGCALHLTESLPGDFFDRLAELVGRIHSRGVCHNDLHKEQNVVVGEDGWPAVVDFQLASLHRLDARSDRPGGRRFRVRCGDDLRHVGKHLRRYTRRGSKGAAGPGRPQPGAGVGPTEVAALAPRSFSAAAWRRLVKPVYNSVTRRFDWKDGEPRRASSDPWPVWTAPLVREAGEGEGSQSAS